MIRISVIIPVYNTDIEKLKRCVSSLVKQKRAYHDLVLVDDGSKNEVAIFLDDLCQKIPDARVIHTPNRGASAARNLGVKECLGNYIMFVDADDVVAENMIDEAYEVCSSTNADVIYGMIQYIKDEKNIVMENNNIISYPKWRIFSEADRQDLIRHLIALGSGKFRYKNMYVSRGPIARLVKREFLMLHLFKENMALGEDEVWNIELAKNAKKLAMVSSLWYYYIYNAKSATKKFRVDSINEQLTRLNETVKAIGDEKKISIPILEKKIDIVQEMMIQFYIPLLKDLGIMKVNRDFRKMLSDKRIISCSLYEYYKIRLKYKIKYLLYKYTIMPVSICKLIIDIKMRRS